MLNKEEMEETEFEVLPGIDKQAKNSQTGYRSRGASKNPKLLDLKPLQEPKRVKRPMLMKKVTKNFDSLQFRKPQKAVSPGLTTFNGLNRKGLRTQRGSGENSNKLLPKVGDKNSQERHQISKPSLSKMSVGRKPKNLRDYHHPMSKWMHIAYSSPKPRSSRMYQELIANYNLVSKEEAKRLHHKIEEKEVPFQVA